MYGVFAVKLDKFVVTPHRILTSHSDVWYSRRIRVCDRTYRLLPGRRTLADRGCATGHSSRKRKPLALFHILQGIENVVDDFCPQGLLLLIKGQTIATPYFAITDVSVLDRASVWFPVVQLQYSRRFEIQNLVER